MARAISEIYDDLNAQKATMQQLDVFVVSTDIPGDVEDDANRLATDIKSESNVAIWRFWLWLMAFASWIVETLFDRHTADIALRIAAERPHTLRWYAEESKKWQYGYAMEWDGEKYYYAIDDPDSRIIKYAAASEKGGKVYIKVAKDNSGIKVPLTTTEKNAFIEFWSKWKDAGVKLVIISQAADILKITLKIVRNRLVLDANNCLLRDPTINPIELAIDGYGTALEFDGIMMLSKLIDEIQVAEGVIDVKLISASAKPAGGNYAVVDMAVEAVSGYFVLSYDDSNFTYLDFVNVPILY